jgi:DNA-binding NtrC family response regulator
MVMRSLVSVVDDDESVRESLPDLLKEFGFAVRVFASAEEFLASDCVGQTRLRRLRIFGQQDKLRADRSKGRETWA